jgi:hypothetical protein
VISNQNGGTNTYKHPSLLRKKVLDRSLFRATVGAWNTPHKRLPKRLFVIDWCHWLQSGARRQNRRVAVSSIRPTLIWRAKQGSAKPMATQRTRCRALLTSRERNEGHYHAHCALHYCVLRIFSGSGLFRREPLHRSDKLPLRCLWRRGASSVRFDDQGQTDVVKRKKRKKKLIYPTRRINLPPRTHAGVCAHGRSVDRDCDQCTETLKSLMEPRSPKRAGAKLLLLNHSQ